MLGYWWIVAVVAVLAAAYAWMRFPLGRTLPEAQLAEARREFHRQRERLEAKFMLLGFHPARQDAPRWTDCEFDDDVAFARHRTTGELTALVGVTIEMEEPGSRAGREGDMVGNLRAATAVFRFHRGHWETDGRAIFNLTPAQALRFYHRDLEAIDLETPTRQ